MTRVRSLGSQAGFSLVETVAALGILAMAAVPLLQISTDATRNTAVLETRLLARTVAENVMNRALADPILLDAGLRNGSETQMGRAFTYTLTVSPVGTDGLQGLEVLVREDRNGADVTARLVSLKATLQPLRQQEPIAPVDNEAQP
ncbi:MAG: type II secretion system minor pseudopilin GspI [Pseudomonadota bacterium]